MSVSRYKNEIALGANVLLDVSGQIEKAKAEDGKVDAGEAFQIFLTAVLSGLMLAARSER